MADKVMMHTPGPWINCNDHVDDNLGRQLCRNTRDFDNLNPLDFRLMAAAPEMLAMLKRLEWVEQPDQCEDACGICGGIKPGTESDPVNQKSGHEPDCELAALIAKAEGK